MGLDNPFALSAGELVRLIEDKAPRAIGNWRELGGEEYARAFTVAGTAGYDIVRDLQAGLLEVLAEPGATEQDFVDRVFPILRQKGWLADRSNAQVATRLLLIYDTNLRTSQAVGRWNRIQKTKAALPYLYSYTAQDDRVRHPPKSDHDHRAFEGILLPVDHPFWLRYFPPLGFRCRCQVVQRTRSQAARLGGVTSDAELAERIARLGEPWGFNPGALPLASAEEAASRANGERLEGAPRLEPGRFRQDAQARWDAETSEALARAVEEVLGAIFQR
jgi:uncharacterized protein with gpF-like domain